MFTLSAVASRFLGGNDLSFSLLIAALRRASAAAAPQCAGRSGGRASLRADCRQRPRGLDSGRWRIGLNGLASGLGFQLRGNMHRLYAGEHFEATGLQRVSQSSRRFRRRGREGQRVEGAGDGIGGRLDAGDLRVPQRLLDGRADRPSVRVGRRADVAFAPFEGGDLGVAQLGAGALHPIESTAGVPVNLVDGPRHQRRLLQLFDELVPGCLQLRRQLRPGIDEFLEWEPVEIVDARLEGIVSLGAAFLAFLMDG